MILDRPPKNWQRPYMPTEVRETVCARQGIVYGRFNGLLHFDHRPGLWERQFNTKTWDTIPPANDPDYIEVLTAEQHDRRTNGIGGEKRITSAGSDTNRRAKERRLAKAREAHAEALKLKARGIKKKSRWPKRSFSRKGTQ